jgi:hypothetical protein
VEAVNGSPDADADAANEAPDADAEDAAEAPDVDPPVTIQQSVSS